MAQAATDKLELINHSETLGRNSSYIDAPAAPMHDTQGRTQLGFEALPPIDKDADDICKTHLRDFVHLGMTSHRHYEFARKLIFGHWQPRSIEHSVLGVSCRRSVTHRVSEALALHRRPAALRDLEVNFKLAPNDYFDLWL